MNHMRAKLGIWHARYALYLPKDLGPVMVSLTRRDDGKGELAIMGNAQGCDDSCYEHNDTEGFEKVPGLPWHASLPRPVDCPFARCELMPVDLREHSRDLWVAELPHDDTFPWPKARTCESYVYGEEILAEVIKRRAYAERYSRPRPTPPAAVTKLLTPEARKVLFAA